MTKRALLGIVIALNVVFVALPILLGFLYALAWVGVPIGLGLLNPVLFGWIGTDWAHAALVVVGLADVLMLGVRLSDKRTSVTNKVVLAALAFALVFFILMPVLGWFDI